MLGALTVLPVTPNFSALQLRKHKPSPLPGASCSIVWLVASIVLVARSNGLPERDGQNAAVACAHGCRSQMRNFSGNDVLETWYSRLNEAWRCCRSTRKRCSGCSALAPGCFSVARGEQSSLSVRLWGSKSESACGWGAAVSAPSAAPLGLGGIVIPSRRLTFSGCSRNRRRPHHRFPRGSPTLRGGRVTRRAPRADRVGRRAVANLPRPIPAQRYAYAPTSHRSAGAPPVRAAPTLHRAC